MGCIRRIGERLTGSGGINTSTQRSPFLNGKASSKDVAENDGAVTKLYAPRGANLSLDEAGNDDVLSRDGGTNTSVGTHRKTRSRKANDSIYFAINQ